MQVAPFCLSSTQTALGVLWGELAEFVGRGSDGRRRGNAEEEENEEKENEEEEEEEESEEEEEEGEERRAPVS